MSLHHMLYVSRAFPDESSRHLRELLPASRQFNSIHGISGLLVFDGRHYAQVLEGSLQALLPLMSRIARDRRHHGFKPLFTEPIAQRAFEGWALGYAYDASLVSELAAILEMQQIEHGRLLALTASLVERSHT